MAGVGNGHSVRGDREKAFIFHGQQHCGLIRRRQFRYQQLVQFSPAAQLGNTLSSEHVFIRKNMTLGNRLTVIPDRIGIFRDGLDVLRIGVT